MPFNNTFKTREGGVCSLFEDTGVISPWRWEVFICVSKIFTITLYFNSLLTVPVANLKKEGLRLLVFWSVSKKHSS